MPDLIVTSTTKQAWIEAVVARCGCDPATFNELGQAPHTVESIRTGEGRACPNPRAVEDHGVISFWNRSLLKRLRWRLTGRI